MNICVYSSVLLLISATLALYKKYHIYACLLFVLLITSFSFHYYKTKHTFIMDRIVIIIVIMYTFYLFCKKNYNYYKLKIFNSKKAILTSLIFIIVLLDIHLFIYGYYTNEYCYNKDKNIGELYHSLLHFITAYGFNTIIIL
jgi:hypothetical protein